MTTTRTGKKTKTAHDPSTGRFEQSSPLNDPQLLDYAIRVVRASDELLPLYKSLLQDDQDQHRAALVAVAVEVIQAVRESFMDTLKVPGAVDWLHEVKKPVLRAARLPKRLL